MQERRHTFAEGKCVNVHQRGGMKERMFWFNWKVPAPTFAEGKCVYWHRRGWRPHFISANKLWSVYKILILI